MFKNKSTLLLIFSGFFILTTCKEVEKEMMVSTGKAKNILVNSADIDGLIIDIGKGAIQHGHCYATTPNVNNSNTKTQLGIPLEKNVFTSQLTGLTAGTKYYIKAYITDGAQTVYGKEINFSTLPATQPTLSTTTITSISGTAAVSGGNITSDGGTSVTDRGICWNTSTNPTIENSKTTDGAGVGNFVSNLTGLTTGTTYYVRAYATNSVGTAYGDELSFTTSVVSPVLATLSTATITSITQTTANSGGNITNDGGASITARGVCWNTATSPTITNSKTSDLIGTGSFVSSLIGLTAGTTYYVRAYATNIVGTAYGNELIFTTNVVSPVLATLSTATITNITQTTATSGGNITSDGGASITARGVCWNTVSGPTTANNKTYDPSGTSSFVSNLTGLTAGTTYYVRAYATNSAGTAYGNELSLTTTGFGAIIFNPSLAYGSVSDNDGNSYKTIQIGTQIWMAENLKTTKYRDGSAIPNVTDNALLAGLTTGTFSWYNNDIKNKDLYGAYYNFYTVIDGRNICPTGWHVPLDDEWTTLESLIGGSSVAGDKLKETGVTHWVTSNSNVTNETGFTALPSGYRSNDGTFLGIFSYGMWWTSTEIDGTTAWSRRMFFDNNTVASGHNYKTDCYSIRCIQGEGQVLPVISTTGISAITSNSASSVGNITSDGGATITTRGVCWSTTANPTISLSTKTSNGTGTGSFTASLTGLTAYTTYYIRAYATNSVGTAYGNEMSFSTPISTSDIIFNSSLSYGSISDIDGNLYKTIQIGTQTWMAENLKATKYNDGTVIPNVTDDATWDALTTGALCDIGKIATNSTIYGRLYNWYTVASTNPKNVCPVGWHIPTNPEWIILTTFLGNNSIPGGELKEVGTTHWTSPNIYTSNTTGFTALPGGYRWSNGIFLEIGSNGFWWSSSENSTSTAWCTILMNSASNLMNYGYDKVWGFSVRCLKDF